MRNAEALSSDALAQRKHRKTVPLRCAGTPGDNESGHRTALPRCASIISGLTEPRLALKAAALRCLVVYRRRLLSSFLHKVHVS